MRRSSRLLLVTLAIVLAFGFYFRVSGLYRGLTGDAIYVFHPDAPKQVRAVENFLRWQYFTYVGSRMYDGYPLGLNHLDEWLIRAGTKTYGAATELTSPEVEPGKRPSIEQLYCWVRALRVLYGMAVILMTYWICRRLAPPGLAVVAAALVSLSPLSITVCKSGSGDIGLDLFGMAALLALAAFAARPARLLLVLSGFGVGCAFGAKYQGLLFGGAVALWLLIEVILKHRTWKMFIADGVAASAGCVAGILFTIPQFATMPSETWEYIVHGVEYIKNYNTSDEFMALPWHERAGESLGVNTMPIILSIGWPMVVLSVVGLVAAARRVRGGEKTDTLTLAYLVFAFLALLASLAGKRHVQPFHFSYLVPIFAIGAAYGAHTLWKAGQPFPRILATVLIAVSCASLFSRARSDDTFWSREDLYATAVSFAGEQVLDTRVHHNPRRRAYKSSWLIKRLYLESRNAAVFRNRPRFIAVPGGEDWVQTHIAPVPSIPFHRPRHWIFMDGPVFPINDRMMRLRSGLEHERGLVFYTRPETVTIGLRSGAEPCRVSLDAGGAKHIIELAAHSQDTVELQPARVRHQETGGDDVEDVYIVPLRVRSDVGAVWLTVLDDPRELWNYAAFGGNVPDRPRTKADRIVSGLFAGEHEQIRFIRSRRPLRVPVSTDWTGGADLLPVATALPAGAYSMTLDLTDIEPGTAMQLIVSGVRSGGRVEATRARFELDTTQQRITYRFTKPFAPYECTILAFCESGSAVVSAWNLEPDGSRMLEELTQMHVTGEAPDWMRPAPGDWLTPPAEEFTGLVFDDTVEIVSVDFPGEVQAGTNSRLAARARLLGVENVDFGHLALFCHLIDESGSVLTAFGCELGQCAFGSAPQAAIPVELPADLPPGAHRLRIGVWNTRTRHRLPLTGRPEGLDHGRDSAIIRQIEIVAAAP